MQDPQVSAPNLRSGATFRLVPYGGFQGLGFRVSGFQGFRV